MKKSNTGRGRQSRATLLATSASLIMAVTGAAAADPLNTSSPSGSESGAGAGAGTGLIHELAPQIVIAAPGTPTTARDPVVVTGVGQMIIDEQNGFVGLCTGTLINPRTVIFAAHCVNDRAANAYGQNSGGQPIGFGFSNNNNAAGNSAFGNWLSGYQTNTGRFMYDANYVAYNPLSLEPNAATFLYGDIALASLDTPAANVPTWALLFSKLAAPASIGASGTGYHVVIDGYGNNGTGITGSVGGIDFRRRIAENMLGGLASLDHFENFLFGGNSTTNPQNLYWIDFDDPRRGTATPPSPFDFNAWRDNGLPLEGTTSSGDSGGPLILDAAFARQVVIGVLSGGYSRFFNGQPADSYGTASFYQPLYLYWDWIAANNPYHYASAVAGNGAWTDPTHWVTNLDPSYQIVSGGVLVNGIPTNPGGTNVDNSGQFGQACFQSGGVSDCLDMGSDVETVDFKPIGTSGRASGVGHASTTALLGTDEDADAPSTPADAPITGNALPVATLLNGLPGATNFVPNNTDGNRLTLTPPRYFDVTLSATGTTTLSSAATVDRLTVNGAGAGLTIASGGSLTSLMAVNHLAGTVNVNGSLISVGDYLLFSGVLGGSGSITAPFLTNMLGAITPGTVGTIGTLTVNGNLILTSGSALLLDLGASGTSDRIAVAATTFSGSTPTNGMASVGGVIGFASASGSTFHAGDTYTILTAQGGVSGAFATPTAVSAILTPRLTYTANSVLLTINAGLYRDLVTTPIQAAYAQLLDQNRGQGALAGLYGPLDLQNATTIQSTLTGLAPASETTRLSLSEVVTDVMANFFDSRLALLDPDGMDGSVAMFANPVQLAELDNAGMDGATMSDANSATMMHGRLPPNMNGFIAGGYIDGDSAAMPGTGARDDISGWFAAAGIEARTGPHSAVGAAVSYTKLDGDAAVPGQTAEAKLIQATAYGSVHGETGLVFDAQFNVGVLDTSTRRIVSFLGTTYQLTSSDTPLTATAEAGVTKAYDLGSLTLSPRAALRGSHIAFDTVSESGGPMALTYNRDALDSFQARVGATLAASSMALHPFATATYVHDLSEHPGSFGANFTGGVGPAAVFALAGQDNDWGEISAGISFHGSRADLAISADTSVGRDDVSANSVRASASIRF